MSLYSAIDLHSNNNVLVVINDDDKVLFEKRLPNDINVVSQALSPFMSELQGVAVESTFNWYCLVDGLMERGYRCHLVNTAAVEQYSGLKRTDDQYDAFWLSHLMRLGILPTGYIYPKEERAIRDLTRKRSQLVRQKVANILSIQNQFWRTTGVKLSANKIKQWDDSIKKINNPNVRFALESNHVVTNALQEQITAVEKYILSQVGLRPEYQQLLTVDGIGKVLALTIMLETGDIRRFKQVGDYASYCRCVDSKKLSNNKTKGKGNRKNGNKYLGWAYVEAANFCRRFNEKARAFYQRKSDKVNTALATKALAHKLSRACYYIMRDNVPFEVDKLFA